MVPTGLGNSLNGGDGTRPPGNPVTRVTSQWMGGQRIRSTVGRGVSQGMKCSCGLAPEGEGTLPADAMGLQFFGCCLFVFLGPHLRHMEVPRLGMESELQPLAYATATATKDPSQVCYVHHSSRQCQILNPLSKGRDRTHNLMVPSRIR